MLVSITATANILGARPRRSLAGSFRSHAASETGDAS